MYKLNHSSKLAAGDQYPAMMEKQWDDVEEGSIE